jgi:hypothetical protein
MNPEIKKRWIDALKSGDYNQGTESLCCNDSFCCLGVLCDLYIQDTKNGEWFSYMAEDGNNDIYETKFVIRNEESNIVEGEILPSVVADWAGISLEKRNTSVRFNTSTCDILVPKQEEYTSNRLDIPKDHITLAELNDLGASFEYLADVIERNL